MLSPFEESADFGGLQLRRGETSNLPEAAGRSDLDGPTWAARSPVQSLT